MDFLTTRILLINVQERDASVQFHSSAHGMDPDHWTMRSILILKGPSFKQNYQVFLNTGIVGNEI